MSNYVAYPQFSAKHLSFLVAISETHDPASFKEASKKHAWVQSMAAELKALQANGTWEVASLPPHKCAIGCKWVYKTKYNPDGLINKHKACLVAKGFTQLEGVDCTETFAPVSKKTTLHVVLSLDTTHLWFLHQLDVQNAFFHDVLNE